MQTLIVIHNNSTKNILKTVEKFKDFFHLELYNVDFTKEKKKARRYQEDFGSQNLPLLVFEDENLEPVNAIWSESNPNWEEEIEKIINN